MERDFLKQSIRRELDYYRDGLFNEDGDEEWVRAWSAPDDDSMAENGFLNVAMAHLTGDECDEIVLLGTEYGYHQPDYDKNGERNNQKINDALKKIAVCESSFGLGNVSGGIGDCRIDHPF